jgi:hypothetical protein
MLLPSACHDAFMGTVTAGTRRARIRSYNPLQPSRRQHIDARDERDDDVTQPVGGGRPIDARRAGGGHSRGALRAGPAPLRSRLASISAGV